MTYKQYVKDATPDYIIDNDSYKDGANKGFVERYLEIFGDELDQEYSAQIDNFTQQVSPFTMTDTYLDYLAYALGDVPNITLTTASYRNFLSYLVSIWKIKGTKKSFRAILLPLRVIIEDLDTDIEEIVPLNYAYDLGFNYDQGIQYDKNCPTCVKYNLKVTSILSLTADLYNKIQQAIKLVEPLGAIMNDFEFNGDVATVQHITVLVDENGDLTYDNDADPDLVLTLTVDGELLIGGPNAARYFMEDGDLYFIDF